VTTAERNTSTDTAYGARLLRTVLLAIVAFTTSMTIVSTSLKTIATDLGASTNTLSFAISGVFLAVMVGNPVFGKLGDLLGHRRVFLLGAAMLTVFTFLCGLAWNAVSFVGFRFLTGLAISATFPTAMALIVDAHTVRDRARAMGRYQLVMVGAPVIGLVIGGPMVAAFGWRSPFFVLGALAAFGTWRATVVVRAGPAIGRAAIDWPGATTLAMSAIAFMGALEAVKHAAWLVAAGIGASCIALVVAFIAIERRSSAPLVDLAYFRNRNFTGSIVAQSFTQCAYTGGFVIAPLLLQDRLGYKVAAASLILLFRPGPFSAISPLGGRLVNVFGERRLVLIGRSRRTSYLLLRPLRARPRS
jgi:MFS family permease